MKRRDLKLGPLNDWFAVRDWGSTPHGSISYSLPGGIRCLAFFFLEAGGFIIVP
jgi:hypothetical protein